MKTVDFSKVTIRGENTNVYIAMNAQGNLYTTVSDIIEVFQIRIVRRNMLIKGRNKIAMTEPEKQCFL